jgi:cell division protein FtsB
VSFFASELRTSQPSEGIWHSLNKIVLVLIALSISVPIGYAFLPEVSKRAELRERVEQLKGELEREKMQLVRFEREEMLLRNSPEYAGLIARDKLDLMKEGETIYRLDSSKVDPSKFRLQH